MLAKGPPGKSLRAPESGSAVEAETKASVLHRCLPAWLAAPGFGGPRRRRDLRVPGRTYIERREREAAERRRKPEGAVASGRDSRGLRSS